LGGSEAIRRFFVPLFEEFAKPGMSFEMLRQEVDGDTAYIVWKAETADNRFELGTDTFDSLCRRKRGESCPWDRSFELMVQARVTAKKPG
jgi:hypothetical protein